MTKALESNLPQDLRRALSSTPKGLALWNDLTPIARRDFITWIVGAKQSETRARRISVTCSKLSSGKRRPCCYAVVPMGLYKALGENKKAKTTWSALTPDARRDFVSWVDSVEDKVMRGKRIEKTCQMLAKGVLHP